MVSFNTLLLIATASSALVIQKRDTATILSDIKTINTNLNALTSATTTYTGGLIQALPISNAEQTLDTSIQKAGTDAKAQTTPLTSAESLQVLAAANNLTTGINGTLVALSAKKAAFQSAGLTATVTGDIITLKTDTDVLSAALVAVASPDTKSQATALQSKINDQFAAASAAFAA
ncbi:hypothetical protein BP5796_05912 [Coleophoma crateriformis]|uniref:Hydrophobic surface binding protein n=1 Tax=Coleophoma crateriformis TaxID=565419 RepID=A0A3D8RVT6_9HELO|nr:hypothetical protein BP5796_05912 [Coleophoma crateriformis]